MGQPDSELRAENDALQRRIAELEHERDEARARSQWIEDLLENSTIPTCLWHGPDKVYVFTNSIYQARSGKHNIIGKPVRDVFSEHEAPGQLDVLDRTYETGERTIIKEALVRFQQGDTDEYEDTWFNLLFNPVRDDSGEVVGVAQFAVEVTEQVRARQQLEAKQAEIERLNNELQERINELHIQIQLFSNLINTLPFPVFYKEANGIYRGCNDTFARQFVGKPADEIVGKGLYDLFDPEQAAFYERADRALYQTGGVQVYEKDITTVDGVDRTFMFHKSVFSNTDGTPGGIIGAMIDISERKTMEREMLQREERMRLVLDATNDGIWDWHIPSGKVYYSPQWLGMLGYQPGELAGDVSTWESLLHPDDKDRVLQLVQEHMQHRSPSFKVEFRLRTKAGGWKWILARGRILEHDEDGNPVRMLGSHTDMSERKHTEENLQIFRTVVERSPDGVSFVSPEGVITYGNAAMKALLGYDDDYVGSPVSIVFAGDDDKPRQIIEQVVEHGTWKGPHTYYHKDGTPIQVHISVFDIRDADGNIIAFPGIVRDLTDVKQAEAERTALQQQVIEAQRDALRELSAPLLPITDRVVILPLIGTIDSQRAQQIMETLLEGVAHHQADTAILDITGVQVVDTQVANALVQTAQAVRLLGATVVLTGIGPAMAQTLVSLGADLSSIETRGSLQRGIADVLHASTASRASTRSR